MPESADQRHKYLKLQLFKIDLLSFLSAHPFQSGAPLFLFLDLTFISGIFNWTFSCISDLNITQSPA